mmetsp:Transcript_15845/g.20944  ORF Transcript_15845/g.20944 Transcript_15845/m.20944 type:complete len:210 (-) Transcript_15845:2644-3273(-)
MEGIKDAIGNVIEGILMEACKAAPVIKTVRRKGAGKEKRVENLTGTLGESEVGSVIEIGIGIGTGVTAARVRGKGKWGSARGNGKGSAEGTGGKGTTLGRGSVGAASRGVTGQTGKETGRGERGEGTAGNAAERGTAPGILQTGEIVVEKKIKIEEGKGKESKIAELSETENLKLIVQNQRSMHKNVRRLLILTDTAPQRMVTRSHRWR